MRRSCWGVVLLAVVLGLWQAGSAHAIPAFARHESFSCQVCHFRMPELSEVGRDYLRAGVRMPGTEGVAAAPLGQPVALNWANYLSVMGDHALLFQEGEQAEFEAGEVDLWVAGPFDPRWSAIVNGGTSIDEGGFDTEQAYAQYITANVDRFGSGRFGQLQPFAILLHQGGPPILPISTPVVLDTPADTGTTWTPATPIRGVEAGFVRSARWNAYLGAGQPHLEEEPIERHTDIYASADYRFAAHHASVTGYGYWGQASLVNGTEGEFHRVGLFADAFWPKTLGEAGYLTGSDEDVLGTDLDSTGYFLLVEQLLTDRWSAYARYDRLRQELTAGGAQTINGPAIGVSWWAQTDIRLTAEAQFLNFTDEPNEHTLTFDLLWIF